METDQANTYPLFQNRLDAGVRESFEEIARNTHLVQMLNTTVVSVKLSCKTQTSVPEEL